MTTIELRRLVLGENPLQSEADQARARRLLEGLEFLDVTSQLNVSPRKCASG